VCGVFGVLFVCYVCGVCCVLFVCGVCVCVCVGVAHDYRQNRALQW